MELSEVIMQRRSMRDYKDQPVPEDKLPPSSGGNTKLWRYCP